MFPTESSIPLKDVDILQQISQVNAMTVLQRPHQEFYGDSYTKLAWDHNQSSQCLQITE